MDLPLVAVEPNGFHGPARREGGVDISTREAADISDKDSEVLGIDTFADILVEGRKVLDCPQHSLRLVKPTDKTGVDLKNDERACLAYTLSHVPDSPNGRRPMVPVSHSANAYRMCTHRPILEGVQRDLLRERVVAQVVVGTAVVVTVVTNYICQSGSGFCSLARELIHLK